jgi:hypothetical protein
MTTNLTKDDLEKGLKALEEAAQSPEKSRAAALFQKAMSGSAGPAELQELVKSISGGSVTSAAVEPLKNSDLEKSLDVSPYLRENQKALVESMTVLAGALEKSEGSQTAFNRVLATAVVQLGDLVKSVDNKLTEQAELLKSVSAAASVTPAYPPKSQGPAPKALEKSFAGGAPEGEGPRLSKGQILSVMTDMVKSNVPMGTEDVLKAVAQYESFNTMKPQVRDAVMAHAKKMKS